MLDIHVNHVRGAEAVLLALQDQGVVLEKVARLVGAVPPLAERLRQRADVRAHHPVRTGEQAVHMLGCAAVETETRALLADWLEAMERGQARVVTAPTRPELPPHLQGWRRLSRGA